MNHPSTIQPFRNYEPFVKVWPSSIPGLGMGLIARRDIKYGQVVCVYTGRCLKCVTGLRSEYIVQCLWKNPDTGEDETWFLDASSMKTAAGRWVNDACDYEGVEAFKTGRVNNIAFRLHMGRKPHPVYQQWYVEMYALDDIPMGDELFVRYGREYWEGFIHYHSFHDPNILTGSKYEKAMVKF